MKRCSWAGSDPLYLDYHDREWGVPVHDDRLLFEFLILEGAQAGLSWITILKKRENYLEAFANFEAETIAQFGKREVNKLMKNEGIVRNRLKIESTISNAQSYLETCEAFGSFDAYIWGFVDGSPIINAWKSMKDVPTKTRESDVMSKQLKKDGYRFVGSTICYAYMQAVGMVNDHTTDCFRYRALR